MSHRWEASCRRRKASQQRKSGAGGGTYGLFRIILTYDLIQRKPHIILRQARHSSSGTSDVIQLRNLPPMVEPVASGKKMQHGCHPPRESLYFPDPAQTCRGVCVEKIPASRLVERFERERKHAHVRNG